jgi:MoxR-like ATPase
MSVVKSTTALPGPALSPVIAGEALLAFQRLVRQVPVADAVVRYSVDLVRASRPGEGAPPAVAEWVSYGASVRAAQYLVLGGKARALLHGRGHVSFEDIRTLANPVLRHRILTNFHAQSERVSTSQVIEQLLTAVPVPSSRL